MSCSIYVIFELDKLTHLSCLSFLLQSFWLHTSCRVCLLDWYWEVSWSTIGGEQRKEEFSPSPASIQVRHCQFKTCYLFFVYPTKCPCWFFSQRSSFLRFWPVCQFEGPNWVATLNAGKGGAHASYYHRANKQVEQIATYCTNTGFTAALLKLMFCHQIQVGVEFEASTRTQETTTSFGYQMELPEANMVFRGKTGLCTLSVRKTDTHQPWNTWNLLRDSVLCLCAGMINSRCIIGGVLEKRLVPLPATLIMGAFVNHRGDKLQVGLGINVG